MAESLLSSNLDIIFIILSLLPTETLLRVKSVCRAWAQIISDPAFAWAHSSRPAPITAFFTLRYRGPGNIIEGFKPFQEGAKFPSTIISGILSSGFQAASRNHGLICFRRDLTFLVGNPATSRWSVVRCATPNLPYEYDGVALVYDPALSLHFKLAVGLIRWDTGEAGKYYRQFNVYSSETSSWTVSSEFSHWQNIGLLLGMGVESTEYLTCKAGGGLICWTDEFGFLVGYEISSDTFWKIPEGPEQRTPNIDRLRWEMSPWHTTSYDGLIYHLSLRKCDGQAKVWRLEGKDSWVLEEEGSSEGLCRFRPNPFEYDRARRALLLGGRRYGEEVFVFYFLSSRLEILWRGDRRYEELFNYRAHANTLAPFHGAQKGIDGLAREFSRIGLSPLDL